MYDLLGSINKIERGFFILQNDEKVLQTINTQSIIIKGITGTNEQYETDKKIDIDYCLLEKSAKVYETNSITNIINDIIMKLPCNLEDYIKLSNSFYWYIRYLSHDHKNFIPEYKLNKFWILLKQYINHARLTTNFKLNNDMNIEYKYNVESINKIDVHDIKTLNQISLLIVSAKDRLSSLLHKSLFTYSKDQQVKNDQKQKIDSLINFPFANDLDFYNNCSKVYTLGNYSTGRSKARVNDLTQLGIFESYKNKGIKYLDFGAGTGENAFAIAKHMRLKIGDTFACDVKSWFGNDRMSEFQNSLNSMERKLLTLNFLTTNILPYSDKSIDFITCFQVLHHLEYIDFAIKEFNRILKVGGRILVREHNCENIIDKMLIDVEHSLFELGKNTNVNIIKSLEYIQSYYGNYMSRKELIEKFTNNGFSIDTTLNYNLRTDVMNITEEKDFLYKYCIEDKGETKFYYLAFIKN